MKAEQHGVPASGRGNRGDGRAGCNREAGPHNACSACEHDSVNPHAGGAGMGLWWERSVPPRLAHCHKLLTPVRLLCCKPDEMLALRTAGEAQRTAGAAAAVGRLASGQARGRPLGAAVQCSNRVYKAESSGARACCSISALVRHAAPRCRTLRNTPRLPQHPPGRPCRQLLPLRLTLGGCNTERPRRYRLNAAGGGRSKGIIWATAVGGFVGGKQDRSGRAFLRAGRATGGRQAGDNRP